MVIVKLMGGLGNQMFQYAAARRLAHARRTELKLDTSYFATDSLRRYALDHFNLHEHFATAEDIARVARGGLNPFILAGTRLLQATRPYHRRRCIRERQFHFDRRILDAPGDVYLDGYWQSEKYFADIRGIIQAEFTPKRPLVDAGAREMLQQIQGCVSVGVHLRRGDYVSDPRINAYHGVCDSEYYETSVRLLTDRYPHAHLFIFSDDPESALADAPLGYPGTVVGRAITAADHEEFLLMTCCQHFIIANSTFSWWAAWLGTNPDKLVFAPGRWFTHELHDTRDLLPSGWTVV
jgi:hypothetical protein